MNGPELELSEARRTFSLWGCDLSREMGPVKPGPAPGSEAE